MLYLYKRLLGQLLAQALPDRMEHPEGAVRAGRKHAQRRCICRTTYSASGRTQLKSCPLYSICNKSEKTLPRIYSLWSSNNPCPRRLQQMLNVLVNGKPSSKTNREPLLHKPAVRAPSYSTIGPCRALSCCVFARAKRFLSTANPEYCVCCLHIKPFISHPVYVPIL